MKKEKRLKQFFGGALCALFSFSLLACPYCAGTSESSADRYIFLIISIFIALTYIPYALIFRVIIRNKGKKKSLESNFERFRKLSEKKS